MSLNYLDYAILVILLLFVIRGYLKGIIVGLASIAALVLGIYAAIHFSNYLESTLVDHLHPSKTWVPILSFSLMFLLVVLGVMLVAKLVEKLVDLAGMGFLNHLGGALLGVVKGALLISILVFIFSNLDPKGRWIPEKDRKSSFFYSNIAAILPKLMKTFGGEIKF